VAAGEPRAVISGPTSGAVGAAILLDLQGSASDPEFPLQVQIAPADAARPALRLWFDAQQQPGLAVLTAPRAGQYTVVVIAGGKPAGSDKLAYATAVWPVQVSATPTPPVPIPDPPVPPLPPIPIPPAPLPTPTGKLWGVLIVPAAPTAGQAALRTSPAIRTGFAGFKDTFFASYLGTEAEVSGPKWQANLAAAGALPVVLWIDAAGAVVKSTPAATEAAILADLRALRGGN
jgi:hypothetical protein